MQHHAERRAGTDQQRDQPLDQGRVRFHSGGRTLPLPVQKDHSPRMVVVLLLVCLLREDALFEEFDGELGGSVFGGACFANCRSSQSLMPCFPLVEC